VTISKLPPIQPALDIINLAPIAFEFSPHPNSPQPPPDLTPPPIADFHISVRSITILYISYVVFDALLHLNFWIISSSCPKSYVATGYIMYFDAT